MMMTLSVAALVVAALISWNLFRRFGADRLESFSESRRVTSMLVSRGELVDGNRHIAPPPAIVTEVATAT